MLKISTFNIRCYGLGGEYSGRFRDEKRNSYLKSFIRINLSNVDFMVFQEIVDLEGFKTILPEGYVCTSYEHSYKRHQKVVICYKDSYSVELQIIPNVVLDERFSRPAVYALIKDSETDSVLLNLIGVHLKSGHLHTETRLQQSNAICEFIKSVNNPAPFVLCGDFNSQPKSLTELEHDDITFMQEVYNEVGLVLVPNTIPTYHTHWEKQILDHFFVSRNVHPDLNAYNVEIFDGDINKYYKNISDHIPLVLEI